MKNFHVTIEVDEIDLGHLLGLVHDANRAMGSLTGFLVVDTVVIDPPTVEKVERYRSLPLVPLAHLRTQFAGYEVGVGVERRKLFGPGRSKMEIGRLINAMHGMIKRGEIRRSGYGKYARVATPVEEAVE